MPRGRRAYVLTVVLSLLLPGLGHVYMGRLGRALIWLAGLLAIGLVLGEEAGEALEAIVLAELLAVFAALDIALLMRGESRSGRRR